MKKTEQKTFITSSFQLFGERKMLTRRMKDDRKGIGGFFFDTPVLLSIILVITVFTISLYQLYVPIQEEKDRLAQDRTCIDLKNRVQDYQNILDEENEKFSIKKLEALEEEELESHLKLKRDYDHNISFEVLESEQGWSFGNDLNEENSKNGISSYRTPISLVDEDGSYHLGKLKVSVWES